MLIGLWKLNIVAYFKLLFYIKLWNKSNYFAWTKSVLVYCILVFQGARAQNSKDKHMLQIIAKLSPVNQRKRDTVFNEATRAGPTKDEVIRINCRKGHKSDKYPRFKCRLLANWSTVFAGRKIMQTADFGEQSSVKANR